MPTSLRSKTSRKPAAVDNGKALEPALLALENACLSVLDTQYADRRDSEALYWQHRFINIANPVSLALMESKGPRHFHYHYRHREHDESILHPVLEDPIALLAQVCRDALECCHDLVGIDDLRFIAIRGSFERALAGFLAAYETYAKVGA